MARGGFTLPLVLAIGTVIFFMNSGYFPSDLNETISVRQRGEVVPVANTTNTYCDACREYISAQELNCKAEADKIWDTDQSNATYRICMSSLTLEDEKTLNCKSSCDI